MAKKKSVAHYRADDGTNYTVVVPTWWLVGSYNYWEGFDGPGVAPLPSGIRMRQATLVATDGSGRHRNFPIPIDVGAYWAIGKTFELIANDGSVVIWTQIGKIFQSYQPAKFRRYQRAN